MAHELRYHPLTAEFGMVDAVPGVEQLKAPPQLQAGHAGSTIAVLSMDGPLQAAALDKKLANGGAEVAGPLAGVPIAIKVRCCCAQDGIRKLPWL